MCEAKKVWLPLLLAVSLGWGLSCRAQENGDAGKAEAHPPAGPTKAYHLDFLVNEVEEGRKVNTRHYSMNLMVGERWSDEIKIGTRVPLQVKQGEYEYVDVGTRIWCMLRDADDVLTMQVRSNLSSFATPEQEKQSLPLLRQFVINGSTIVAIGRLTAMGSVDDPDSKRQFQLEVTVTPLKP